MSDSDEDIVSDGDLRLRPLRDTTDDYALIVTWRNQPHVREWWEPDKPPMTVEEAILDCRPCITGEEPGQMAIIEVDSVPVGFVQYYPWSAFPDEMEEMGLTVPEGAWTLDIYVGDPNHLSRGIGSRTVRLLCDHLVAHEGATAVAFGVERDNITARRSYEKAGMTATVEFLDTDTSGGKRVWSVLMVRMAADTPESGVTIRHTPINSLRS